MPSRSIEMQQIQVPLEAVKKLSDEDRFSYYLLGHMFNELMSLQKIIGFALPKHDDVRPARIRPEHAQAMFMFRLACGKLWEATLAIRQNKVLAATLRNVVLPRMTHGAERLKALNVAVNDAPWLAPLRNGLGFHYPSYTDWKSHVVPDEFWVDDYVFLGSRTGNTFYDAADSVAQGWMFRQYGATSVRDAVDPLINQMIDLLRIVNTFLEDVLGTFIADVILEGKGKAEPVGKVLGPRHDSVSIPFWTAM